MEQFDVCVVGHVVRDINLVGGRRQAPTPGGTAYYSTRVYRALGLRCGVVTRVAREDEDVLLGSLRAAGIQVFNSPSATSSTFHNDYAADNPDIRTQSVDSLAEPIRVEDVPPIRARVFHIGPLSHNDVDLEVIGHCAARAGILAVDAQGWTRKVTDHRIVPSLRAGTDEVLPGVDVLQADDQELAAFSGEPSVHKGLLEIRRRGVAEVIVTKASRGSMVAFGDQVTEIEALPPREIVDTTGCGDTYLAAYMSRRLDCDDPLECGRFAAVAASLNIEGQGPFQGRLADVWARRSEADVSETLRSHRRAG